jgi:hypothetical protein
MDVIVQLIGSAVAVAALVAFVAWAKIARPAPPLDPARARALFADECDRPVSDLWLSADGAVAVGRAQTDALVAWRVGDGYAVRRAPLAVLRRARIDGAAAVVSLDDAATGPVRIATGPGPWPPAGWTDAPAPPMTQAA